MEIFYEQFLHNKKTKVQEILNNLGMFFLIVAIASLMIFNIPGVIISIGVYVGIYFYCSNKYVEYEYELTNNELQISKITNQKKRKVVINMDINKVSEIKDLSSKNNTKIVRCFVKNEDNNAKLLVINDINGKVGYALTMDNELKTYCKRINPKVFISI